MKISFLLPDIGYTGGSQVIYEIMDRLSQRGHEIYLVTPSTVIKWDVGLKNLIRKEFQNTQLKAFSAIDIDSIVRDFSNEFLSLDSSLNSNLPFYFFVIGKITDSFLDKLPQSDFIIATHNITAYAAYYNKNNAIPIYFIQGFEEKFYTNDLIKKTARLTYQLPLIIISNSKELSKRIYKMYKRKSLIIYPGVDTCVFKPKIDPEIKYNITKKHLDICYYFSKNPLKGSLYFFKFIEELKKIPTIPFKIHLFGDDYIKKIINNDTNIFRYYGKVFDENLANIYSNSDVFINTSIEDSFPLTVIEAMACGTLCLTTNVGNSDYVRDRYNAVVIRQKNYQDIVKEILSFVVNRKNYIPIVKNGIKTAQRFSWSKTIKKFEYLLIKIKSIGGENERESINN
ncbi:MAG: glycosyltransferase family 4 protein [Elusimicrobiales bacterium]|nr:glycosyltransferase family 4 protein [Elusimicrobiales bacterium]